MADEGALARICEQVIAAASQIRDVRHTEVRAVARDREMLTLRNGALDGAHLERDLGVGVRICVGNAWGFAATNDLSPQSLTTAAHAAATSARAVDALRTSLATEAHDPLARLGPAVEGSWQGPMKRDPFAMSRDAKLAPFRDALSVLAASDHVPLARSTFLADRANTVFATSRGDCIRQRRTLCGGGIRATARRDGIVQTRSAPKSMEGNLLQGGFEVVEHMRLPKIAHRLRAEAIALTLAPEVPAGTWDVILLGDQLSLQIHESIGHPTELDRVLGEEVSLAGASFMTPDRLGDALAAPCVNLVADSTSPGGPATHGWDDEGTPATRRDLVRDGRLVGYLSGREAAARLGRESASCLRAAGWDALPIVRMVNVDLEPGDGSLDDLESGLDHGLVLATNRSWSIDSLRLDFQFGCEVAWEVRAGRRTGNLFRNPVYRDRTPDFWRRCRGIAGPEAWQMWGWLFCGKGDPIQTIHVGHGCSPARFDGVEVSSS